MDDHDKSARWIEVTGAEMPIRNLRDGLRGYYRVITGVTTLRVLVPEDRFPDFTLLCQAQRRLEWHDILLPPPNLPAPCGLHVIDKHTGGRSVMYHRARCPGCAEAEGRSKAIHYRKRPVTTVLSAPSLAGNLTQDGLILAMRLASSEALELAAQYDAAIAAIEQAKQLDEQMASLKTKVIEHQRAIKYFLHEEA
jgi:hypothetical protein